MRPTQSAKGAEIQILAQVTFKFWSDLHCKSTITRVWTKIMTNKFWVTLFWSHGQILGSHFLVTKQIWVTFSSHNNIFGSHLVDHVYVIIKIRILGMSGICHSNSRYLIRVSFYF